jgi:broad specificity phosphatase PhoE
MLITLLILIMSPQGVTNFEVDMPVTTIIVVRHAEKVDDSNDPDLSSEGEARAIRLAQMLENVEIDVIYSTNYKRTRGTVSPVASEKSLEILLYDPRNEVEYAQIFENYKGKTILISGHSNTVPMAANYYLGEDQLEKFDESDYDNFLILMVTEIGNAKLIHLRY